jgi:hypothetical protein
LGATYSSAPAPCLGPASCRPAFLPRLARFPAEPEEAIDAPPSRQRILYATPKDYADDRWQLALGWPTTEYPSTQSCSQWLGDYDPVYPADSTTVARWLSSHGQAPAAVGSDRLAGPVVGPIWEDYLEHRFFIYDSPEAQSIHYLSELKLVHGPLRDPTGDCVGRLAFFAGTMPAGDPISWRPRAKLFCLPSNTASASTAKSLPARSCHENHPPPTPASRGDCVPCAGSVRGAHHSTPPSCNRDLSPFRKCQMNANEAASAEEPLPTAGAARTT